MSKFKGKNILLTGATGAIGSVIASKLVQMYEAKNGFNKLVLFVKNRDNIDRDIEDQIEAMEGGPIQIEPIDLREPQRIEHKFMQTMKKHFKGRLDVLILCHGLIVEKGVLNCSVPDYDATMLINVRSMMHMVSIAMPFLKESPKSSITILTSN